MTARTTCALTLAVAALVGTPGRSPAGEPAREAGPPGGTRAGTGIRLNDRTYWLGNTWGGGSGRSPRFMQMALDDIALAGDRIFAICLWDERGSEAGVYTTDGERVTMLEGWHSWGRRGGPAAAADDNYVYLSMFHDPADGGGRDYSGVARYHIDGRPAGWPGAIGNPRCHLLVNENHKYPPTGLAVSDGELFVSDPSAGRIRVYRTSDMSHIRDLPFASPGRLEPDAGPSRDIWVIDTAANVVKKIGRAGGPVLAEIRVCKNPVALCLDAKGALLVADGALDRQQIRAYRTSDGSFVRGSDFGSPVYTGRTPGVVGPGRFYRITGIRCDKDNNLYVSAWDCGGKLYKFDASRRLVWERAGLEFVSCADADPGEDTSVYSSGHRYVLDYSKAPGEGWKEVAITVDPLSYPRDPRVALEYWMAARMYRLRGQKIMLCKTQMAADLFFFRFKGEIAVPAAMYFPFGCRENVRCAEGFSARWTGFVRARTSGRHVFTTLSDDGVRVWLGGQKIIDNWTRHPPTEDSGELELEAGRRYELKVEYFQGSGGACLVLFWQEPQRAREVVPAEVLFTEREGDSKGLRAEFFRGTDLRDSAQTRVDSRLDYPIFAGDPASTAFGVPRPEGYPPNHPWGSFIWSDENGDGDMQAEEYVAAPLGSQALMVDASGDIWVNTGGWEAGKGRITRIPFAGFTRCGAPRWDVSRASSKVIPAETGIQYLSKLHYDPATDRMYLGVWTKQHPFPGGGWEQMSTGPVLQRFDGWSREGAPRLAWETVITPPEGLFGKVPKAWSLEVEHGFVGYTWKNDQIAVDVYRLSDGVRVGRLLPTSEIGGVTGWLDMNDGVQSHRRADGTYAVFVEEVWMAKCLYFLWKP